MWNHLFSQSEFLHLYQGFFSQFSPRSILLSSYCLLTTKYFQHLSLLIFRLRVSFILLIFFNHSFFVLFILFRFHPYNHQGLLASISICCETANYVECYFTRFCLLELKEVHLLGFVGCYYSQDVQFALMMTQLPFLCASIFCCYILVYISKVPVWE